MSKVVVYEALRRDNGSVYALGNSKSVDESDAAKLVESGEFVCLEKSFAKKKAAKKAATEAVMEDAADGDNG